MLKVWNSHGWFVLLDLWSLEKVLEITVSAAVIASATWKLLFFFNTSFMYGWLLIIYFKIFCIVFSPSRQDWLHNM